MTSTEVFELAVSCYLRELEDDEFDALTRRVRPPKAARYPAKRKRRNASSEVNNGH